MKRLFIAIILMLTISACTSVKQHEKTAQIQAQQSGLTAVEKPRLDAVFTSQAVAFSQYKKIIINDLDLSQVAIIEPGSLNSFPHPWQLTDDDKRYYHTRFAESAKRSLLDTGDFLLATSSDVGALLLKTRIIEIAPHASKDDFKSRPTLVDVYSEGFGSMTIVFELYDSTTNQLVMIATDQHDLGNLWEQNNRVQNNFQIRLAFDFWLNNLRRQLKDQVKN